MSLNSPAKNLPLETLRVTPRRIDPETIAQWQMQWRPRRARIVVTGLGAITCLGSSAEEMWQGLLAGKSGVAAFTRFDTENVPVKIMAEVKDFEPRNYMEAKEARRMARFSQLGIGASRQAIVDAKLIDPGAAFDTHARNVDPERIGVVLGTCTGGFVEIRQAAQVLMEKGAARISPFFLTRMMHNAAAANISREFGLLGYNSTVTTACAAGAQAIGEAAEIIRRGAADIMIAGGTESSHCDLGVAGFYAMRAMTANHNDEPERASRPFDKNRDGLVGAEGAAILVLERLEHAQARGAKIYAEVLGYGCSADAAQLASPDAAGLGESRAMSWAMEDARLSPDQVDYISAHATATPIGDAIEARAIHRVFADRASKIPVSAAKSMMGHAIGASGAIEAIASILTIRDGILHPTINYETPDPACDLDVVPNTARRARVNIALSNSFGMGGQNVALVFGKV
jgi:3-oxoacyl-[acyl-carrier-protein] synthase II